MNSIFGRKHSFTPQLCLAALPALAPQRKFLAFFRQRARSGLWALGLCGLCSFWPGTARAAEGDVDTGFNPNANADVQSTAMQPDGKIVIGGGFTSVGGAARNRIARLNANGTLDTGFDPNANDKVWSMAVQADGKIVIGGRFNVVGNMVRYRIARLHANGTLDTGFDPNANDEVNSMSMQADGKIVIGGRFTTVGGTTRNRIARLHANGTLDTGFNPGVPHATGWSPGVNSDVLNTAVQADGKIVIGGFFTYVGDVVRNRIARLHADGTLDTGFNSDYDVYGGLFSTAVQADGKIVIGGNFTNVAGMTRSRIARLHANGTLDTGFNPDANWHVYSTTVQADGKMVIGGEFTTVGGTNRNRIARLHADGTLDTSFINPTTFSNLSVNSMAVQADGKIVTGGSLLGGFARDTIVRLLNGAATQTLTVPSAARVVWLRGGTAPETTQVTFELSTDGITWTPLGNGIRISGGWELTGLGLPASGTIRARARTTGGSNNSSGVVEQQIAFSGLPLPEIAVEQPAGTNLVDGTASIAFGSQAIGTPSAAKTFTIKNTGNADLTGLAVTKDGSHSGDFSVGALGATTLAPGTSTTFSVTFTPSGGGARSAAIHIASNDSDENPFDTALTGTGLAPEIVVEQPAGTNHVDGTASIALGSQAVGTPSAAKTFTIKNTGNADLTGLAVTKDGSHSGDFSVGALGATILAPGTSTTFSVTFTPSALGPRSAAIHIASNDSDENPFDMALTGTGLRELAVLGNNTVIADGDTTPSVADGTDFGSSMLGAGKQVARMFTLTNSGNATFNITAVNMTGSHAEDFTVSGITLPAAIAAAGQTTFTITFMPSALGTRSTAIHIACSDSDENPFDFMLRGNGATFVVPISIVDYEDTFTVGTTARPDGLYNNNSGGGYGIENAGTNPVVTWTPLSNFSFNSGATSTCCGYPGNGSNAGAASGLAQSGGGDFSIAYGLRENYVVAVDAILPPDRLDISSMSYPGAGLTTPDSLSVFFRRSPAGISIFNGTTETPAGVTTGVTNNDWHNYAVRFDRLDDRLGLYVDGIMLINLDLTTFAGGAYAHYSNVAVGLGGTPVFWADNFQVGEPTEPNMNFRVAIAKDGDNFVLTWSGDAWLEEAEEISGPWREVPQAFSPFTASGDVKKFYRLRR